MDNNKPDNDTKPAESRPNLGTKEPESPQTQPLQTKPVKTKSGGRKALEGLSSITVRRAIISIAVFLVLWQVASSSDEWFGVPVPFVDLIPAPSAVAASLFALIQQPGFWQSVYLSSRRVLSGFIAAMIIGIPFGLLMAVNRTAKGTFFPLFEVLRPIPPLAWVPAAIIFWPTTELSIAFVTFLGAFYTIVINVVGGAEEVDKRFVRAARSMGANGWKIFRRVIFPATMPSIVTGAVVGMGITWQVVVAAEMIAGGGASGGGGGGLGFFVWNSYVGGAIPQVVVGMVTMGLLGYAFSSILRVLGERVMPWKKVV